jgi:hypothetical protein
LVSWNYCGFAGTMPSILRLCATQKPRNPREPLRHRYHSRRPPLEENKDLYSHSSDHNYSSAESRTMHVTTEVVFLLLFGIYKK